MKQIWKYPLTICPGAHTHRVPEGAQILTVAMQGEVPTIWALVDPKQPKRRRDFEIFGTGHEIDDATHRNYIGTAFDPDGLVWHIFERL